jgi:rfaE bifunctional protein nucleotidyltransferase chain/domain
MRSGRAAERVWTRARAAARCAAWRAAGERVVLANGVFDLLHVGHARYLADARRRGERLVVAVNGDASAAALKGPGRPVLCAADRALLVAALAGVDGVVVFDEANVEGLLAELAPAAHAKGTDYTAGGVPERDAAESLGIETVIAGDPKAHASRDLLARVRARHAGTA